MVAQNSDMSISVSVELNLLGLGSLLNVRRHFAKLLLQCKTRVIGPEHFSSQTIHKLFEVVIQRLSADFVEKFKIICFPFSELFEILIHRFIDLHYIMVSHRVFPQKVELYLQVPQELDMFLPETATPHSVSLVFALFVAHS